MISPQAQVLIDRAEESHQTAKVLLDQQKGGVKQAIMEKKTL